MTWHQYTRLGLGSHRALRESQEVLLIRGISLRSSFGREGTDNEVFKIVWDVEYFREPSSACVDSSVIFMKALAVEVCHLSLDHCVALESI